MKIRICSNVFMFGLLTMAVVRGSLAQEGVSGNEPILMFGTPSSVVKSNVQGADIGNRELEQFISKHKTNSFAFLDIAAIAYDDQALEKVKKVFASNMAVLLKSDSRSAELRKKVSSIFGLSGPFDYALFKRGKNGTIDVYRLDGPAESDLIAQAKTLVRRPLPLRHTGAEPNLAGLPKLTYNIQLSNPDGQVSSVVNIDVIRSVTLSQDKKFVLISASPTTVKSSQNGVVIGGEGNNLWGAYLPHAYTFSHGLSAKGVTPALVDFSPVSDSRTEFDFSETKRQGFAIGGSLGGEISATPKEQLEFAAKTPFSINANITHEISKTLAYKFKDYSLIATDTKQGVEWQALIDTKLKSVLFERNTATLPVLNEHRMTPMMRSASLDSYTLWELPGTYTGPATVIIGGGYTLAKNEWWYNRSSIESKEDLENFQDIQNYELDLNSPYLTREITVLIRSQYGEGKCLTANPGKDTTMESCSGTNPHQQWGYDDQKRYVNRASESCLNVDEDRGTLITEQCKIDNRQQWYWSADRLHSNFNKSWRLYVDQDQLKVIPDDSMVFQDIPSNPFNPLNIPWTSYPKAPALNDVIPRSDNSVAPPISEDWVNTYEAVNIRQRWKVEVLRDGL